MKRNKLSKVSVSYDKILPGFKPPRLGPAKIKTIIEVLLALEKIKKPVSIVFTGNIEIKKLNRLYRYRNTPTDVLSFEYGKDEMLLGEIIISLETAKKQASKYGNNFAKETVILLIHGFYHINGYKHYRKADYHKMQKKEKSAFAALKSKGLVD